MSSFTLKIIALISMLCDHLGYTILGQFSFMNYIGRIAFPIFAFCITEGYVHTKNIKKYFLRLGILAIISQIPYILFESTFLNNINLNIIFTLMLGLFTILLYDKSKNKLLSLILTILLACLAQFFYFDYGWFGIAIIFIFYIFKDNKPFMNLSFILATFANYYYMFLRTSRFEYIFIIFFACLSLIPINLYNGKKGKNSKYLLYFFYPLHFIVLYLVSTFI
jgi:hypothetical protein